MPVLSSSGPQVAAADFYSLTDCVADGKFETCERVAQGDPDGRLANPLAGYTVGMAGPSR